MAFEYHAPYHVLLENNEKVLVDENLWGEKRLTGADLARFQADMEIAFAPILAGIENGSIVTSDLVETVTLSRGQTVLLKVGVKITFPGATSKFEFHPKFYEWAETMKQDPNLTMNTPFWVDETP
jgi:hypothetical protein